MFNSVIMILLKEISKQIFDFSSLIDRKIFPLVISVNSTRVKLEILFILVSLLKRIVLSGLVLRPRHQLKKKRWHCIRTLCKFKSINNKQKRKIIVKMGLVIELKM